MIRTLAAALCLLAGPALAGDRDHDVSEAEVARMLDEEAEILAQIRPQAPRYRFVRTEEDLPGQRGASMPVTLSLPERPEDPLPWQWLPDGDPPSVAALHGFDGRPLDSCTMPCTLLVNPRRPAMLTFYRYGSTPQLRPVFHIGPDMRPIIEPTEHVVQFGYNAVDALERRAVCRDRIAERVATGESTDAEPCLRVPPTMPQMAQRSGHCQMSFTVLEDGEVRDVVARECTELVFCDPSALAVSRWHYLPAIRFGKPVEQAELMTKMTFRLNDTDGSLIEEPDGPLIPCIGVA